MLSLLLAFLAFSTAHLLMPSGEKRIRTGTSGHTMTDFPEVVVDVVSF